MYEREPQPYYGGLVSFFRTPVVEFDQVKEGMAVVAGVPIDNAIPSGRVGARFGPRAIREASMRGRPLFDTVEEKTRVDVDTGIGISPNPPKDTDGRREESGRGVRELQGK